MTKFIDSLDEKTRIQVVNEVKELIKEQETQDNLTLAGVSDEVKEYVKEKGSQNPNLNGKKL